jgi:spore coat protein U-like protein
MPCVYEIPLYMSCTEELTMHGIKQVFLLYSGVSYTHGIKTGISSVHGINSGVSYTHGIKTGISSAHDINFGIHSLC